MLMLAVSTSLRAHGGAPMSLGIQQAPGLAVFSSLLVVYLGEGQGMALKTTLFDQPDELRLALEEGNVDLALELPDAAWAERSCTAESSFEEEREGVEQYFRSRYPGVWVGLTAVVEDLPCRRAAILAGRSVRDDLRFAALSEALVKLTAAIDDDDLAWLRRRAGTDTRKLTKAARELLKEKGLL